MYQLRIYLLSVLFICIAKYVYSIQLDDSVNTDLAQTAYEICPYTSFCQSENNSVPEGYYSCCEECSCSDDCHLANRCCPDAVIRNTNTDLTCKYQFEYFDIPRNIFSNIKYMTYFIVGSCLEDANEDILNGCLQPSTLEDHILVSDKNTSTIYKNAKCAQCNGIQNYQIWDLLVFCSFDEALLSLERRTAYALEHCSLVSKPPNNTENVYKQFRCYRGAIGTCNVTNEWDFYDEDLERACSRYNMVFKDERLILGNIVKTYTIYQNIYCFLCNNKRGTIPNEVCYQDLELDQLGRGIPTDFVPFSAILNFENSVALATDERTCLIDEIDGPFIGECTELYCPFGEVPIHGKCVVFMRETYVSLSAVYKLDITTTTQTDLQNQNFSFTVFQTMVNDIQTKFNKSGCELCNIKLFEEDTFTILARPSKNCPMSKLLRVFNYMASMKVSQHTGNQMTIHMKQTNNFTMVQNTRFLLLQGLVELHQFKERWCHLGVHLTTKFSCARITFDEKDLSEKGVTRRTRQKLFTFSDPFEFEDNIVKSRVICLSDYKRITSAAGNHFSVSLVCFLWTIIHMGWNLEKCPV